MLFSASHVKIAGRRLRLGFLFQKVSAAHSEVAGMWPLRGPHLNTGLPHEQQLLCVFLGLKAVSWVDADGTRERCLPTGRKHSRAIASPGAQVLFRAQGASVLLSPPGLGGLRRDGGDHLACQGGAQQLRDLLESYFPASWASKNENTHYILIFFL